MTEKDLKDFRQAGTGAGQAYAGFEECFIKGMTKDFAEGEWRR